MKTKATVRCTICPKGCVLAEGEIGECRVRRNVGGTIRCTTYGNPCAMNVDPVEKKPLYHFLPGTPIFSVATVGCNLHCKQCQNWLISQSGHSDISTHLVEPDKIARMAIDRNCPSVAYTYTEPLVSFEYTHDCCKSAHEYGLKNVLVTAAYINPNPLRAICTFVDAVNADLKSFSDDFYHDVCGGSLKPVLKALETMNQCGVFLELTNLIIPTLNDSVEETKQLCAWVVNNLGPLTPLHFSRFFPQKKLHHLPPTPMDTILNAREIAQEMGLKHVYVGNMQNPEAESTYCPDCKTVLIERRGYSIRVVGLADGCCGNCGSAIHGVWK